MITALDTNVLLDILIPNEAFFSASVSAIEASAYLGPLVVCDYVYAERCLQFATQKECDRCLGENESLWSRLPGPRFSAGRVWREYRRRGGKRDRILPDFFVAGHAQKQADRLLTRDREFYSSLLPSLKVVNPGAPPLR